MCYAHTVFHPLTCNLYCAYKCYGYIKLLLLGMPFDSVRERKASKSECASFRYRNWVRKRNESGFGNASGTTGTSNEDSEFVGRGVDAASTGRLAQ